MAKKTTKTAKKPASRTKKSKAQATHVGGSIIEGNVTVGQQGKFAGRNMVEIRSSSTEMQVLFQPVYQAIAQRPNTSPADRADLEAEVKEVEAEVAKGEKADENFLLRRLRNIKRMAPDILEVVMAAIANPAAGLGLVRAKITKKMAEESGTG